VHRSAEEGRYKSTQNKMEVKKMALRILSGVLVTHGGFRTRGTAVVDFRDHDVGGNAEGHHLKDTKSGSMFTTTPGRIVAMREFMVHDRRKYSQDHSAEDWFRIHDNIEGTQRLEISWECESDAEIKEISYLIVGEV